MTYADTVVVPHDFAVYTLLQQGDVRIHYTVQAVLGTHDSKIAS